MADPVARRLADQVLRSATSIGANVEEAHGSETRREFARGMTIAKKEARETFYWLTLISKSGLLNGRSIDAMLKESDELLRILSVIVRKTVKVLIFTLFVFRISSLVSAASTSFDFLNIGAGARVMGMGGAGAATSGDSLSAAWNPALVGALDRHDVSFSHVRWLEEFRHSAFAYGGPLSARWNAGVHALYFSRADIQGYDDGGQATDRLDVSDLAAAFTVAHDIGPWFGGGLGRTHVGVSAKYLREDLDVTDAAGYAFDVGLKATPYNRSQKWLVDRVQVGAGLLNWGPRIKFDREKEDLPLIYRAGVSVRGWAKSLTVSTDYEKPRADPGSVRFGAEYLVFNSLALRGGYRWALKDNLRTLQNGFHVGMGVQLGNAWFDYAYVPFLKLDDTHFLTVRFAFGSNVRLEAVEQRLAEHYLAAQRAYVRKDYAAAQKEIDRVLLVDPAHAGARRLAEENQKQMKGLAVEKQLATGKRKLAIGDYAVAMESFQSVLNVFPQHEEASRLLAESRTHVETQKVHRRDALIKQGEDFYEQGNYSAAIDLWEKVLLLDPANAAVTASLEKARAKQEEQKLAAAAAEERKRLEEGWAFFKDKKYEKAQRVAEEALKKNPTSEGAGVLLSQANGRLADGLLVEGRRQFQAGQMQKAFAVLKQANELDADNQIVLDLLQKTRESLLRTGREEALNLYEKQKYDEALEKLEFLLTVDPSSTDLARYRDEINRKRQEGRRAEAERLNREALKAYDEGDLSRAVKNWKKVLELVPDHANAKRNLERALQQLKE